MKGEHLDEAAAMIDANSDSECAIAEERLTPAEESSRELLLLPGPEASFGKPLLGGWL